MLYRYNFVVYRCVDLELSNERGDEGVGIGEGVRGESYNRLEHMNSSE